MLGVVSLLIWALILIVTVKYVAVPDARRQQRRGRHAVADGAGRSAALGAAPRPCFVLGVVGAALFYGDAMITPAISVLSAVEGLKLRRPPVFEPYVAAAHAWRSWSACSRCSAAAPAGVGRAVRADHRWSGSWSWPALGLLHIGDDPAILAALQPAARASASCSTHGVVGFVILGSVFLAVTGAEALYADMGHFGRGPIQRRLARRSSSRR